jgi:hypothetical protein
VAVGLFFHPWITKMLLKLALGEMTTKKTIHLHHHQLTINASECLGQQLVNGFVGGRIETFEVAWLRRVIADVTPA